MNIRHPTIGFISFFCLLLHLQVLLPVVADLASDKQALLNFATAFPRPRKLNWSPNSPICVSWIGVTCDVKWSRVTSLRLPGFGLFGFIPSNTIGKLDGLRVLSLRSNYLSGTFPSDILSLPSLQYLYLQHNNFSGKLPEYSFSPHLIVLDLSYNSLSGNIPSGFQNLSQLTVLYLQNNSFSGSIPFSDLPSLKVLNLSNNNLNGSIPYPLQKFPVYSFLGNSLLCGLPLKRCTRTASPPSSSPSYLPKPLPKDFHSTRRRLSIIIAIVVGGFAALFLLVTAICLYYCLKKTSREGGGVQKAKGVSEKPKDFGSGVQEPEKNKLFFFEGCNYSFDLEDLLRASAEVLGKGSFGTAYKAVLEDGTVVVVKRLREVVASKKEFEQQMEVVGRINQHPNVVSILAYYYSKDEKLLVHKYMPAGSLSALLYANRGAERTPLDWETRMKIALGTANAISHIHRFKCVHGNIKSSNILLTEEHEGCISDVGLAPLMTFPTNIYRAIGYFAPEVIETRKVTQKSDVYSFGVLLLEMLTGKAPLPQPGNEDAVVDLPRWVRSVVREEWTAEVFDVELLRYQNIEEEMVQMLQIGLACVAKLPDSRPEMEEVVRMLEEVRRSELQNRTSSEAGSNVQTP